MLFDCPVIAVGINNITNLSSKSWLEHHGGKRQIFQFAGVPRRETAEIDCRVYGEVPQHKVLSSVLEAVGLPDHVEGEGELVLEESDHHPVPGAPVQLPPQGHRLGSAAEVEPAAETPSHELELQKVVVTSVVEIEQ